MHIKNLKVLERMGQEKSIPPSKDKVKALCSDLQKMGLDVELDTLNLMNLVEIQLRLNDRRVWIHQTRRPQETIEAVKDVLTALAEKKKAQRGAEEARSWNISGAELGSLVEE